MTFYHLRLENDTFSRFSLNHIDKDVHRLLSKLLEQIGRAHV